MNTFGGLKALTFLASLVIFTQTLIETDFWVSNAAARYPCSVQPDPAEVLWLPYKSFCAIEQTMPSSPGLWLIDDYPNTDVPNCAEIYSNEYINQPGGCPKVPTSSIMPHIDIDIPIFCNLNANPDYYAGSILEAYDQDFDIVCEGFPPIPITATIGQKWYVHEPIGPDEIVKEKNLGGPQCSLSVGNPVNIATGNKYHRQQDVSLPDGLEIARHYNSDDVAVGTFGFGWRGSYSRKIVLVSQLDYSKGSLTVVRDDGSENYWQLENMVPVAPPDAKGKLNVIYGGGVVTGFTYISDDNLSETYDASGKILNIENDSGDRLFFFYAGSQLQSVAAVSGRSLGYSYHPDGKVSLIASSDGSTWKYFYDVNDNLTQIENPDGSIKSNHYEDAIFVNALTGESDEAASRIRSWAYDATGRAILSTYGDSISLIERNEITYNPDGSTTTLTPLQNSVNHTFSNIHGNAMLDSISDICASCGSPINTASYDNQGNKDIVTDFNGNVTDYDYTADNLVQKITFAVGTTNQTEVTYTWNLALRKPTQILDSGKSTNYTYNARGQVLTRTITDSVTLNSRTWTNTYFESPAIPPLIGKIQTIDGPRTDVSDITNYEYYTTDHPNGDNLAGDLKAVVNALGHRTDYLKYDGNGRLLEMTDANGVLTSLTYHIRGWLDSRTTSGQSTTFTYTVSGDLTRVTQPDGSFTDYEYDDAHRLTTIADNFNNRVEYTLDAEGNRTLEKTYDDLGVLKRQMSRVYNQLNRLEKLIDGNLDETLYAYDNNNNQLSSTNANLNTTSFEYDSLDRLVKTIDAILGETLMDYDDRDNLVNVTDPLTNATSYTFDGLDNQTQLDSPDTGITIYEYNDAGNRTAATDARSIRVDYSYDALNRLISMTYPDISLDVSYSYDAGVNGKGRLTSMTDAAGMVNYSYDARGNLLSEDRSISEFSYITSYTYNGADRLISITYPSNIVVDYTPDAAGRIIAVDKTIDTITENLATAVAYEPFGPVRDFTYGNGLPMSAQFDQDYELDDLDSGGLDWTFGFDPTGNITAITDNANALLNQSFIYDDLNRLTNCTGSHGTDIYTYDTNGNRLSRDDDGILSIYGYQALSNQLTSRTGWTYTRDATGNRTQQLDASGDGFLYTYGDHNRLVETKTRTGAVDTTVGLYIYDGAGRRVSKTSAWQDIHFIYGQNGELLGEYSDNANGSTIREYVYLNGELLATYSKSVEVTVPPPTEIIIDNNDTETSSVGTWKVKTAAQQYGVDYREGRKTATGTYRWSASTIGAPTQDVFAWWVAKNKYSKKVEYTISYAGGTLTDVVTKSHKAGGGQWQLLGFYNFGGTQDDYIEVSAANGKTVADAIRFAEPNDPIISLIERTDFVHTDHLGTPRSVTDDMQIEVWRWDSDPFGIAFANEDPDGDLEEFALSLRFPGQYYDAESGVNYNYFRTYDPEIGRYVESDPSGLKGGINTFAYLAGNPILNVDPLGLAYFAFRPLNGLSGPGTCSSGTISDRLNLQPSHEELFFEDGKSPGNLGFHGDSNVRPDIPSNLGKYACRSKDYNDCVMRKAVEVTEGGSYCLVGLYGQNNCQDWAARVRANYGVLLKNPLVREECPGCGE